MASRFGLRTLARTIRSSRGALPVRGEVGGPVPPEIPPTQPIPEDDDLTWYDGTRNPEPLFDNRDVYDSWPAIRRLLFALGAMGGLYSVVAWTDPASKNPAVPRVFPYDNLSVELGLKPADEGSK